MNSCLYIFSSLQEFLQNPLVCELELKLINLNDTIKPTGRIIMRVEMLQLPYDKNKISVNIMCLSHTSMSIFAKLSAHCRKKQLDGIYNLSITYGSLPSGKGGRIIGLFIYNYKDGIRVNNAIEMFRENYVVRVYHCERKIIKLSMDEQKWKHITEDSFYTLYPMLATEVLLLEGTSMFYDSIN